MRVYLITYMRSHPDDRLATRQRLWIGWEINVLVQAASAACDKRRVMPVGRQTVHAVHAVVTVVPVANSIAIVAAIVVCMSVCRGGAHGHRRYVMSTVRNVCRCVCGRWLVTVDRAIGDRFGRMGTIQPQRTIECLYIPNEY